MKKKTCICFVIALLRITKKVLKFFLHNTNYVNLEDQTAHRYERISIRNTFNGSEKQMTLHHRLNRDVLKTKSCQNLSMLNK